MTRRRHLLLLAVAFALSAPAAAAPLEARYALVVGQPGADGAHHPGDEDVEWLLSTGAEGVEHDEVTARFGFSEVDAVATGMLSIDEAVEEYTATTGEGASAVTIRARTEIEGTDTALSTIVIARGDEILSAPTIRSRIGESAMVASSAGGASEVLWFVLRVAPPAPHPATPQR